MSRRGFTVMEIVICAVIVGVLVTVGVPVYRVNAVEDSKSKVCETNLRALKSALDAYALENDVMPGDLSQLPLKYIENAYAQLFREKGAWKIKLAYFITGLEEDGIAHAGLMQKLSPGNTERITCPSDLTPPESGGISYGVFAMLKNMSAKAYKNLSYDTPLIGDCESGEFNSILQLDPRHELLGVKGIKRYANVITKGGMIKKIVKSDLIKGRKQVRDIHIKGSVTEDSPAWHGYEMKFEAGLKKAQKEQEAAELEAQGQKTE